MYHRRIALFSSTVALLSLIALGAGDATATAAPNPALQGGSGVHVTSARPPTVHTRQAVVGPKVETVLVNAKGLPLYYFRSDTPTMSKVSGGLARLWPPLLAARPTAFGVNGRILSVKQAAGPQVSYRGHFLYTFIDDSPGHVTGQGVSNFFIVTPNISAVGGTRTASSSRGMATNRSTGVESHLASPSRRQSNCCPVEMAAMSHTARQLPQSS
jgi:predicted lipoprotein with Yx(FWY)xxD motif